MRGHEKRSAECTLPHVIDEKADEMFGKDVEVLDNVGGGDEEAPVGFCHSFSTGIEGIAERRHWPLETDEREVHEEDRGELQGPAPPDVGKKAVVEIHPRKK